MSCRVAASVMDTLLVRFCQIDEKRPETCCSAHCSTARETACPGGVYSAGQVRDLAWTRPFHAGSPAAAALGCSCGFPSVARHAPLATFAAAARLRPEWYGDRTKSN